MTEQAQSALSTDNCDKVKDYFNKLADDGYKIIVSLGSGAMVGFATNFSLMEILENCDLKPKITEVWGSSAGAISGSMWTSGYPISEIEKTIYNLKRSDVIEINIIAGFLGKGFISGDKLRNFLHEKLTSKRQDCQDSFAYLANASQGSKNKIKFRCGAVNFTMTEDGKYKPLDRIIFSEMKTPDIPISEAVVASGSILITFQLQLIKMGQYELKCADSWARDPVFLKPILYEYGYNDKEDGNEKICIIAARPNNWNLTGISAKRSLGETGEAAHDALQFNIFKNYQRQINDICIIAKRSKRIKLILIEPEVTPEICKIIDDSARSAKQLNKFRKYFMPESVIKRTNIKVLPDIMPIFRENVMKILLEKISEK